MRDSLVPKNIGVHRVRSWSVIWVTWVVYRTGRGTICDFGNASSHKVVEVEWDRAIWNFFASEVFLNSRIVLISKNTHTWFSGRKVFIPREVSDSFTLVNNQLLEANPPTRTTCWKYRRWFGKIYLKNDDSRFTENFLCAVFFWWRTAVTIQSTDGWKNWAISDLF